MLQYHVPAVLLLACRASRSIYIVFGQQPEIISPCARWYDGGVFQKTIAHHGRKTSMLPGMRNFGNTIFKIIEGNKCLIQLYSVLTCRSRGGVDVLYMDSYSAVVPGIFGIWIASHYLHGGLNG